MIFKKGAKIIQRGKSTLFSKWCWDNWIPTFERMKLDIMWKFSSRWINDLYIGLKTMKLLEENKRGKLHDLEFRNDTKSMSNKRKKLGFIKKIFLCIKEHRQENEKTTHKWENI